MHFVCCASGGEVTLTLGAWEEGGLYALQILRAIGDGMDCRGYYIWTLVDK